VLRSPPRGQHPKMVFARTSTFALWERGRGSTNANLADATKVTVFFRKAAAARIRLIAAGRHLRGSMDRENLQVRPDISEEDLESDSSSRKGEKKGNGKKGDREKKGGFGVLIKVERAEDFERHPRSRFDIPRGPKRGITRQRDRQRPAKSRPKLHPIRYVARVPWTLDNRQAERAMRRLIALPGAML